MRSRIRRYEGAGRTVTYDIPRCIHVAECVRRLPEVFDPEARPWIRPGRAGADELAETVAACPTGALGLEREGEAEPTPGENALRIEANGPLYVKGEIEVTRGGETLLRDTRVALCRCGDSANRPLCDGAHRERGFVDPGESSGGQPDSPGGPGAVRFTPAPDGPLLFRGPLTITDAKGNRRRARKGALCRCGATATTPLCDGTHQKIGFRAP